MQKLTHYLFKFYKTSFSMEIMNLGEALSLLKKEKSRLARLINLRKDNVYVEEGKKSEFNPKKLSEEINIKIEEINTKIEENIIILE